LGNGYLAGCVYLRLDSGIASKSNQA
jgi:hypothetical protein